MITFEKYMKDMGLELLEWQKEAAREFLKVAHKEPPNDRRYIVHFITVFLMNHGNCFDLDVEPEPKSEPKPEPKPETKKPTVINNMYSEKEIVIQLRSTLFVIDNMEHAPDELYDEVRRLSAMLERVREGA